MWIGYAAIGCLLVSLVLICIPKLFHVGIAVFCLALILAPVGVVLSQDGR
jgi:hypothetical protein